MKTVVIFLFIFGICPVFVRYLLGIFAAYLTIMKLTIYMHIASLKILATEELNILLMHLFKQRRTALTFKIFIYTLIESLISLCDKNDMGDFEYSINVILKYHIFYHLELLFIQHSL